ncbi:MAG: Mov34/MPN/PAD-1 family protein [Candidatus Hermodarchaeota archaeon]
MGKITDTSIVTIKPMAYYKMLVHVLRFGSKTQTVNEYKEAMGMLIGHQTGQGEIKDVIVEDVIPISHGGSIEVKFSPEQLGAFGEIDRQIWEEHGDKNWFTVGWYHSHPNLGIFFSSTDIFNQLFWQDKNSSGLGIVFDHSFLEKPDDLGFRVFRLEDPSKGLNSKYYEVKANVEPPDSNEFYEKIIDLINTAYSKEPPILELNETTELFGDIFFPEQKQLESKIPELSITELISNLKNSFSMFIDSSLEPLIRILNFWSQEIVKKTYYNNSQIRNDLIQLKENLSGGVTKLQKSFNFSLQDKLKELDFYIDDKLDDLDNAFKNVEDQIESFKESFIRQIHESIENTFLPNITQMVNKFDNNLGELNKINEDSETILKDLEKNYTKIDELNNLIEPTNSRIKGAIEEKQEVVLINVKKRITNVQMVFSDLDKDLRKVVADLKAAILVLEGSKTPVLNKIEKLENEKKNLHNTIRDLKSEIKELKK